MDVNRKSRQSSALLASLGGIAQQLTQILGNFIYRTVFLMILSEEYLGINGLFSNILQLFSLAELGIGTAISYNLYSAFARQDKQETGALIHFYKNVYHIIALAVLAMGLCFYPFIGSIVNTSEIPSDVNITVVYFLFVLRSVSSYLFVYKQSVVSADQRTHLVALFSSGSTIAGYVIKIAALAWTKNYNAVLLIDTLFALALNWGFSLWITKKYKDIFRVDARLPRAEKWTIVKNTFGLMCHKIGGVVATSTDNIVLSKYVSLRAVGLYSNYAVIVSSITALGSKVMANLIPTVANYVMTKSKDDSYGMFKKVLYINLWITSFTTVCLYFLLNPFITLWLGEKFLLSKLVVAVVCLQHYLLFSRQAADVYTSSCGLFALDKIRPLIEAGLNLVISVVLAKEIGIAGVFVGTCISNFLTVWWRQPYLVIKRFFNRSSWEYWWTQIKWFVLTVGICFILDGLFHNAGGSIWMFLLRGVAAVALSIGSVALLTFKTEEFCYLLTFVMTKLLRRKH